MSDDLYLNEIPVKEEVALNGEITGDEISNVMDSHIRSAEVEDASANRFIDELNVSII